MNKSSWMSEEGYRNAVAKGTFSQVQAPEPDGALTTFERIGRGVVGLGAIVVVIVLVIAIVMSAAFIGATESGPSDLVMWTLPWVWETFKLGCYNIAKAIALLAMAAAGWLIVMIVWEQCVALGSLILKSKNGKR